MHKLLDGKVAVISGGASGLGRATAELFAQEGARVVLADKNCQRGEENVRAIEASGGVAAFRPTDVRRPEDVQAVVQYAEDTFGKLDIMVANAGIVGTASLKRLEDVEEDEWMEIHDVNLSGVWRCFKFAAPAIRRAGGGSMSATSSLAGIETLAGFRLGAYTSSKAAVCALASYFASELAADRIRVNTVCPGGMLTNIAESASLPPEALEAARATMKAQPFGKFVYPIVDPVEVARVHLFLNSELAGFVTGQTIVADGGGFINSYSLLARGQLDALLVP